MTRRQSLLVVFHGLLLVLLGMLVGLPFHEAITSQAGPDAERAWRVAHTSLVGGGTLYLGIGAVASQLVLGPRAASVATASLVFAAWAFAVGFLLGPAIGARGLEPVGPPLHVFVFALFVPALLLALLAIAVLLRGAWLALRRA
jgi:vacuolar-type H+-ATPase subunit I/STV1